MPLITVENFREAFEVSADIGDGRIARYVGAAARRLRQWVGPAKYAEAAAITLGEAAPEAARDLRETLELVEATLAMHYAIRNFNTNVTPGGVVETAKVEGNAVLGYFSPEKTRQFEADYLAQAEELARPYLLSDGTPDAPFAVVESDG
jgi:hypothetical protein